MERGFPTGVGDWAAKRETGSAVEWVDTHHEGWTPPLLLVVDTLWNLTDWSAATWLVTIPASFITVFVPTLLVQRYLKEDPPARALRLALLLGALAAVPTSIFGTPAGLAFLAWSGLNRMFSRQPLAGGRRSGGR